MIKLKSRTQDTMAAARRFARAKIQEGYRIIRFSEVGTPRTKAYRVVVKYGDKR